MQSGQSSSVQVTLLGLQKLKEAKHSQRSEDGKRLTFERINEKSYVSLSRVKAFFRGEALYRENAQAIAQVLGLELADLIESNEAELSGGNTTFSIDWQTFQEKLDQRQRLTTNPLTGGSGMRFNSKDIYVPLGLVERKQKFKHSGDVSPEKGSNLSQPTEYEITRKFEHDEFFEQVLKLGESPKSQGRRIAIIGEPGAGKTTRLQQIADWVFEETDGDVAIWVSLADLQGRSLEEYLLQVWLKDALKSARVTPEMEDALVESFNQGQVWLLLDGVDEMGVENPLQAIARHLRGWIAEARVILTCRVNVWDAGKNALEDEFDVYRNLDFNFEQVNQFIDKWFDNSPKQGQLLKTELEQAGKERIRDTVKNPLRLALLCRTWQQREGALPETKAALYRQFTEALYQWKEESFPTTSAQRRELEAALGRLALGAIDQPSSRFRLTRRQVCETLGETDAPLFQLALNLGWLNQVGVAAENPDEPVYAFYHPTFEEYFAALAIDDWHFFLNHVPHNPTQGTYRIFEPQWKEVILLWLGREDVDKEQKEEFIRALVTLDDECGNFYRNRALCLAAAGISEFRDCNLGDQIVAVLVEWGFGYFDQETQKWKEFIDTDAEQARDALRQTDPRRATKALVDLITCQDGSPRHKAVDTIEQILNRNQEAFITLFSPMDAGNWKQFKRRVDLLCGDNFLSTKETTDLLLKIFADNQAAIRGLVNKLVELLYTTQNEYDCLNIAEYLLLIDPMNQQARDLLVNSLLDSQDETYRHKAANLLLDFEPNNAEAAAVLVDFLRAEPNGVLCHRGMYSMMDWLLSGSGPKFQIDLKYLNPSNCDVVNVLTELLHPSQNQEKLVRLTVAHRLLEIDPSNLQSLAVLIELLPTLEDEADEDICYLGARLLELISSENSDAVKTLTKLLYDNSHDLLGLQIAEKLWQIDPGNPEVINSLTGILHNSWGDYEHLKIAKYLWEINPGNSEVIPALIKIMGTNYNEYERKMKELSLKRDEGNLVKSESPRVEAAKYLWQIDSGNPEVIKALIEMFSSCDESTSWRAENFLEKIAIGNQETINALLDLLRTSQNEELHKLIICSLSKLAPDSQEVVNALIELLRTSQSDQVQGLVSDKLTKLAPDSQEVVNALIELLRTSQNKQTLLIVARKLLEISPNNRVATNTLKKLQHDSQPAVMSQIAAMDLLGLSEQERINFLDNLLDSSLDDNNRWEAADKLLKLVPTNQKAIQVLVELLNSQDEIWDEDGCFPITYLAANRLKKLEIERLFPLVVTSLKDYLSDEVFQSNFSGYYRCYKVLWDCAQHMTYPDFYQAWHSQSITAHPEVLDTTEVGTNSLTLSLNFSYLSQSLHNRISLDSQVGNKVKLICIDGSKFIDPDNPASKIYTEMVKGGCPKSDDGMPKTMPDLQAYWDLLTLETDKQIILVFYHLEKFSPIFLDALSKFDGTLCVVAGEPSENLRLQQFSANQPQLLENILGWIRARVLENL